jgi:hypothetical protein
MDFHGTKDYEKIINQMLPFWHRVGRVLGFFSSRRNWDSPTPLAAGGCAPPPLWSRGEGTLAGERGVGGVPIPTTGEKLSTLPTLCVLVSNLSG